MATPLVLTGLWLLFVATHIGLTTARIRDALVARLGLMGFGVLYSVVAAVTFAAAVHYWVVHRFEGPPGPALGAVPWLRAVLVTAVTAGIVLIAASSVAYQRSPTAVLADTVPEPRGFERVTRHGLFAGIALLAGAHALLATRLVTTMAFVALAVLAVAGGRHQDRKLRRLRGPAYDRYVAETSFVPFAAILAGRQQLGWREQPYGAMAAGLLATVALRTVHAQILADGGAWFIAAVIGFAGVQGILAMRRQRRRRTGAALVHRTA